MIPSSSMCCTMLLQSAKAIDCHKHSNLIPTLAYILSTEDANNL
jgi:hypothetical protein